MKPFHLCAAPIVFVAFITFSALEAARSGGQIILFYFYMHWEKKKKITHVYKALTHPSTL